MPVRARDAGRVPRGQCGHDRIAVLAAKKVAQGLRGVGEWLVVVVEVKEDIVVRRLGIASDGDRDVVPLGGVRLQRHRVDQGRERIDQAVDYALAVAEADRGLADRIRSEEHTSELQSLMRISYAVFCLKKKNQ